MQNFRAYGLSTTVRKLAILAAVIFASLAFAQAQDSPGRFELGGSLAAVRNFRLPSDLGVGLEADVNFGRHLAFDSAVDFLPSTSIEGTTVIGLFGVKVGT